MPRLNSLEDLKRLREEVRKDLLVRVHTGTRIIIAMGTCGIAVGARETMSALLQELAKHNLEAHVETVGCLGLCAKEPLVTIEQSGKPRIIYGNVKAGMVPRLVNDHLVSGKPVHEWELSDRDYNQISANVGRLNSLAGDKS